MAPEIAAIEVDCIIPNNPFVEVKVSQFTFKRDLANLKTLFIILGSSIL